MKKIIASLFLLILFIPKTYCFPDSIVFQYIGITDKPIQSLRLIKSDDKYNDIDFYITVKIPPETFDFIQQYIQHNTCKAYNRNRKIYLAYMISMDVNDKKSKPDYLDRKQTNQYFTTLINVLQKEKGLGAVDVNNIVNYLKEGRKIATTYWLQYK